MATFSVIKRASALLQTQSKSILQRAASVQATKEQLVDVSYNDSNGITTLSLARGPVNSLNLELIVEIRQALETSVKNKSKGVILTSSLPKVFSAGLDIREIIKPDVKRLNEFWNSFQDMWLTLYGLKVPIAVAVNGAGIAGGCLLAMCCEYRVMVDGEHKIGINDSWLGIPAPKFVKDTMIATIGHRQTEHALLIGSLFKPDEALSIGLIDELAADKNDALAKCEKYILGYANISSEARAATKLSLRKEALDWLKKNREIERKNALDFLLQPKVQEDLDKYMKSLKKKANNSSHRTFSQMAHAAKRASTKLVEVFHNETNGITTLSLARAPVNSLNLEFLVEIRRALETCRDNNSRGIILTSSLPTVFSAGVDIREMHRPDVKRCNEFWGSLQDMWLTLYGMGIPTAAAINGSSPGAGCLLALSCEYRVMVRCERTIGFNGPQLGVVIPKWIRDTLIRTIGYRQAELALLRGKLFKPDEALNIGLVDELVSDKNEALARCEDYILSFASLSSEARAATKMGLREEALDWLRNNREQDTRTFVDALLVPKVQEGLDKYMEVLKKKSKK